MRDYVPRIHAAGGELVIVGSGTPEQARWFVEDFAVTTPVFANPALELYRAVGARRGIALRRLPSLVRSSFRAMRKGYFQTRVLGDGNQHGGTFVVARGGAVVYHHLSRDAGDHPPPEAVVAALEGLPVERRTGGA